MKNLKAKLEALHNIGERMDIYHDAMLLHLLMTLAPHVQDMELKYPSTDGDYGLLWSFDIYMGQGDDHYVGEGTTILKAIRTCLIGIDPSVAVCVMCHKSYDERGRCGCRGNNIGYVKP